MTLNQLQTILQFTKITTFAFAALAVVGVMALISILLWMGDER